MSQLPTFMKRLVQHDETAEALDWCENRTEEILVHVEAGDAQSARDTARAALFDHGVTDVEVNPESLTVHAGPCTGYHTIQEDPRGTRHVCEHGSYVHDPTGVEFDAECPDDAALETALDSEPRDAAAEAAWRRTRL